MRKSILKKRSIPDEFQEYTLQFNEDAIYAAYEAIQGTINAISGIIKSPEKKIERLKLSSTGSKESAKLYPSHSFMRLYCFIHKYGELINGDIGEEKVNSVPEEKKQEYYEAISNMTRTLIIRAVISLEQELGRPLSFVDKFASASTKKSISWAEGTKSGEVGEGSARRK